jgi:hypothetical protein
MSEPTLTVEQAYDAMFYFLENEFSLAPSDELAGLLSSLSRDIWVGGTTGDPAAWQDWLNAVIKAKEKK